MANLLPTFHLSEAKDLLFPALSGKQVLRFAQDDKFHFSDDLRDISDELPALLLLQKIGRR